jgi:hypothetical protein
MKRLAEEELIKVKMTDAAARYFGGHSIWDLSYLIHRSIKIPPSTLAIHCVRLAKMLVG